MPLRGFRLIKLALTLTKEEGIKLEKFKISLARITKRARSFK